MIKAIIFDFDGVILDSMPIKSDAFRKIFADFDEALVEKFIEYHVGNGGISRFVKIRYFFENLLLEEITESEVLRYAAMFSNETLSLLLDPKYIIAETLEFIVAREGKERMFVASGAEQGELRYLCDSFGISRYFDGVFGSPAPKSELLAHILTSFAFLPKECAMIGDSINDYEAASKNKIPFFGYNNPQLKAIGEYIDSFKKFMP